MGWVIVDFVFHIFLRECFCYWSIWYELLLMCFCCLVGLFVFLVESGFFKIKNSLAAVRILFQMLRQRFFSHNYPIIYLGVVQNVG